MSSGTKSGFGHVKWIVIIALGVVSGLVLWTAGNAIVGEWLKSRREREATQQKAELAQRSALEKERIHAWSKIMLNAQFDEKAQHMPAGTAPMRKDGTLRSRIESTAEYK